MTLTFTADRKALLAAVRSVVPAVGRTRDSELTLSGVRLAADGDRFWVAATDLDLALQAPISTGTTGVGAAVIPARRLLTVLSLGLAGEEVTTTLPAKAAERVRLSSGATSAWVDTYPNDEWPPPHREDGAELVLSAADVAAMKRVSAAASTDDARPILNAVCLAGGFAVATDSYRLSAARVQVVPERPLLLPLGAVRVLPDEGVTLTVGTGIQWGTPTDGGWSRLIEGDYPNWQTLMPKETAYSVVFDREGLLGAVVRAEALIGPHSAVPMLIERAAGGIQLGARDSDGDLFSETVDEAEMDEGCPGVAVNPRLLVDLLRSADGRRVRVGISDPLKPLLITAEGDDPEAFRSLLMPVRTEWSSGVRAA